RQSVWPRKSSKDVQQYGLEHHCKHLAQLYDCIGRNPGRRRGFGHRGTLYQGI
ncbi:hypothetical protein EV177_003431, partial [Coemansia sp. RSA 1804]